MVMPGNSREVIVKALEGLSLAPHTLASKVVNGLSDAGFRIVDHQELATIIRELLVVIETYDKLGQEDMNKAVIEAKALIGILAS
ncbi:hypothetical protein [Brucella pituitosa]|uniref:hypothetical protein n=1 Tax=Brucella pituitosa TaxID=571256 RepID=UPI000C27F98F|nr:hypothetical protein [Brucella pituitosa]PJO47204.1 hypothetical protein CWE02_19260 [Brucella pituitosa]